MITTNIIMAVVIFLILLAVLYFLSKRALSGDARYMENLEHAAQQGDVYSQFKLGQIYFEGEGIDRNDEEAAQWFQRAAQQDHAEAQYILGTMYEQGSGVEKNEAEAFRWFSKAAAQGHGRAVVILDSGRWSAYLPMRVAGGEPLPHRSPRDTAEELPGEPVVVREKPVFQPSAAQEASPSQLDKYLAKAEHGDVDAQYNLGIMYYHGEGVEKDLDQAILWFHMAAEQDDADAQYNLGLMYGKGEGTGKDPKKSVEWFKKASEKGHQGAREILEKLLKN
jgi:TPR repeat protein